MRKCSLGGSERDGCPHKHFFVQAEKKKGTLKDDGKNKANPKNLRMPSLSILLLTCLYFAATLSSI